jgi:hypothetical protein
MQQETIQLLLSHYKQDTIRIPASRIKSEWTSENMFGFFVGVALYGDLELHVQTILTALKNGQFDEKAHFDTLFDYYIRPFHKSYVGSECNTPTSSRRASSIVSNDDLTPTTHYHLKKALLNRDKVCLFCWDVLSLEGAHIIAQKDVAMVQNQSFLLERAGLTRKHQVQNGLLLCKMCHSRFDSLKRYVDVVEGQLVLKVVNVTDDEANQEWIDATETIKEVRTGKLKRIEEFSNRKAVEPNGEMGLYFVDNNPATLPTRKALGFHKTACLIWRMAGGAESDEEYCSDDDEMMPVNTAELKRRFNIKDSAVFFVNVQ